MARTRASSAVCAAWRASVTTMVMPALWSNACWAWLSRFWAFAQSIGRVPAGIRGLGDLNRILRLIKFHYRLILTRRQSGSVRCDGRHTLLHVISVVAARQQLILRLDGFSAADGIGPGDRKSTRLNSSHL